MSCLVLVLGLGIGLGSSYFNTPEWRTPGVADPPEWRTQIPFQGYHFFKNKTSCIFIMCHYNAVHLCF